MNGLLFLGLNDKAPAVPNFFFLIKFILIPFQYLKNIFYFLINNLLK